MQTRDKFMRLALLAVSASLLLSLSTLAAAQSDAVRALYVSAASVPTNIPGVHTYAEPPKGFNPVNATDSELAIYGFPARPDKQADPDRYAGWERAMKAAKMRWNGELKVLSSGGQELISSGSSQLAETARAETGPSELSTTNASGVVLSNTQTAWSSTKSFNLILAEFSVPVTQFPFNSNCSQDYANEFTFIGIDDSFYVGANNAEVFKPGMVAGIQTAVWCNPNQTTYQAAFGWAPLALLATFAVDPGDVLWAEVQIQDANDGYVYLEDLTTGTLESYAISTCEAGVCTNLRGRTAGWTVSRGCCEGPGPNGEWPLANTTHIFVGIGEAENGAGKLFWPGSQSPAMAEVLYMLDDGLDQSIETVSQGSSGPEGSGALLFSTTGCAQSGGCTP